ncbi:MAG: hypothetical protein IT289_04600, partial [Oligoflexia bacterium]|nr:hypothetical protein [Oligoflexia bacterium]
PTPTPTPTPTPGYPPDQFSWYAPTYRAADLPTLFSQPHLWTTARNQVRVLQFYQYDLETRLSELSNTAAFSKLKSWRIRTAIEHGAIKDWDCGGLTSSQLTINNIDKVTSRGGDVHYISMDEPALGGRAFCNQTMNATAQLTAQYMTQVKAARPQVKIGDIEPYPSFSVNQLITWVDLLISYNQKPDFLNLDVDRNHAQQIGAPVAADLSRLRTAMNARGIKFGVIIWSHITSSEQGFYNDALSWANQVRAALGSLDHLITQSWSANAVPLNLPENDPGYFSLLRLFLNVRALF